ncbi:MAG: DUF1343 domain-containing protein [Puniceicoccales bacterium]|jgi:uncharacterized protein YbbC (DUF1343 family)|nr:DUF1343 domain-containing protein [Puniceicoccales bacterium]
MKTVKIVKALITIGVIIGVISFIPSCIETTRKPIVKLGIDMLEERGFDILQGKTVGILTNQAGVNGRGELTWKLLKDAPGISLKAIFAPVHGLEGRYMSLETFYHDEVDNIPVYSVFASNSRPKDEWLQGIDAMVIDLQGLGIRYYNYWAAMVYTMVACFTKGIEVIVLDRPNPLSGNYIGGPIMDRENTSVWGPIVDLPLFYGLTIGELAKYCKSLKADEIFAFPRKETGVPYSGLQVSQEIMDQGKLTVIPMEGWKRGMRWEDTGLKWKQTSPNIVNLQSAYEYAFLSFATFVTSNYGHDNCNFIKLEPDWRRSLPFHRFYSKYTTPKNIVRYIYESLKDNKVGFTLSPSTSTDLYVDISVKDIRKTLPASFGLAMLALAQKCARFYFIDDDDYFYFATHIGDKELAERLRSKELVNVAYFLRKWKEQSLQFIEKAKLYWMYD